MLYFVFGQMSEDIDNTNRGCATNGNKILSISICGNNQGFVCGTTDGFIVYDLDPLRERFRREMNGSIGHIEMLISERNSMTNLFAIVGAESHVKPVQPPNHLIIWDDRQKQIIKTIVMDSNIKGIQLNSTTLCIALETKIYIYRLCDYSPILIFPTYPNPNGLVSMCMFDNRNIIAFPSAMGKDGAVTDPENTDRIDLIPGYVRIVTLGTGNDIVTRSSWSDVKCHESALHHIQVSSKLRIITASERGTLVRVHTREGKLWGEFRRGSDGCNIYSTSINNNNKLLSVVSDKNTLHIFNLNDDQESPIKNSRSSFSYLSSILPSIASDKWSALAIRIANPTNSRIVCVFSQEPKKENVLYVITSDGKYYKYIIGAKPVQDYHAEFFGSQATV